MSGKDRAQRSRELAAYLKAHKIERTTGMCPMGCGRPIPNGGEALISHLGRCRGRRRNAHAMRTT